MNIISVLIVVFIAIFLVGLTLFVLSWFGYIGGDFASNYTSSERLRTLVNIKRKNAASGVSSKFEKLLIDVNDEDSNGLSSESPLRFSLKRKLYYAGWAISPLTFILLRLGTMSLLVVAVLVSLPKPMILGMSLNALILGYALCNHFLDKAIKGRSDAFDQDYPTMLMSFASLLKTGMNPMQALEKSSYSLEPTSIVRDELEVLADRLRLGLNEEESICGFAIEILHPEIELFVQALVLNVRVGGKLSSSIERLVKQVRKRKELREKAISSVGIERGSIWAILAISTVAMVIMYRIAPNFVGTLFFDPKGQMAFSYSILVMHIGVLWSRKLTDIMV